MAKKKDQSENVENEMNENDVLLNNLKKFLKNKDEIQKKGLHIKSCELILEYITEMENNNGNPIEGIRTLDGSVMYPCPRHIYSPISNCIATCDKFIGSDSSGICVCKEKSVPGYPKYSHQEARRKEIDSRREKNKNVSGNMDNDSLI